MAVTPSPTHTHTHTPLVYWFMGADIALWIRWDQADVFVDWDTWAGRSSKGEREREETVSLAACTRREECLPFCTC